MAFKITYHNGGDPYAYHPAAASLLETLEDLFGTAHIDVRPDSTAWENFGDSTLYHGGEFTDRFESLNPEGKLWLMLNAPPGYTIDEDT